MRSSRFLAGTILVLITGCTLTNEYRAFRKSHEAIQSDMTLQQVFERGLADYLITMKTKNIPGATLPERQPVSKTCDRHVFDVGYWRVAPNPGEFYIRVYCNQNEPSSTQVEPERSFKSKEEFVQALGTIYSPWVKSMGFRVESPPKRIGGVYDHYEFTIDENGKVSSVSPIVVQ